MKMKKIEPTGYIYLCITYRYLPGDMFSIKKLIKMTEHHNREYQEQIDAHKESHDPQNPRSLIDTYITRMNKEQKVNPNTNFSGKWLNILFFFDCKKFTVKF